MTFAPVLPLAVLIIVGLVLLAFAAVGLARGFARLAWISMAIIYIVAYLGAYVRHAEAELACGTDWPLCNGSVFPGLMFFFVKTGKSRKRRPLLLER